MPEENIEKVVETSPDAGRTAAFNFIADRFFKGENDDPEGKAETTDESEPNPGEAEAKAGDESGKESAPPAKPDAAAAAKPEGDPGTAAAKPTKRRKVKEVDEERIAEIAARAASEATARISKSEPKPDPQPQEFTVPEEFADDIDVYRTLAELYPEKYGSKAKERLDVKLQKYAEARQKYEAEWKKEHPGEQFDISDEEHESFVSDNYPVIEEREIKQARRAYQEKLIDRKAEEKVAPIQRQIATEKYLKQITPIINKRQDEVVKTIVAAVDSEAVKYMASPEEFAKMAEEEPIIYQALQETGPVFIPKIQTAIAILSDGGELLYEDSNPLHQSIVRDIKRIDETIRKSGDTQDEQGREYLPIPQYRSLPPSKRGDYWTIDTNLMVDIYSGKMQEAVSQRVSHLNSIVEKKMKVAKPGHSSSNAEGNPAPQKKAVSSGPSIRATGPVAGSGAPKQKQDKNGVDLLLSRIFSGS